MRILPTPHILGRLLGLKIKIDDPWFGLLGLGGLSLGQNRLWFLDAVCVVKLAKGNVAKKKLQDHHRSSLMEGFVP